MINKFEEAKNKLVLKAENYAAQYLLSKYGSAHLVGDPKVELTSTIDPDSSSVLFQGRITVYGAPEGFLSNQVGVNMTINSNDIEVEGTEDVQATIEQALNSAENQPETVVASLGEFQLFDTGTKYLNVGHPSLQGAIIGCVGKDEYNTSKNKAELLSTIVKDAMLRVANETTIKFEGSFVEPVIEKGAVEKMPLASKKCERCEDLLSETDPRRVYDPECAGYLCPKHEEEYLNKKAEPKKSWLGDLDESTTLGKGDKVKSLVNPALSGYVESISYDSIGNPTQVLVKWENGDTEGASIDELEKIDESKPVSISENMPRASMTDHLAQSLQLEDQKVASQNEKIKTEAVNALVSMLKSQGYGSAKVAEVVMTDSKIDAMVTLDDAGTIKAVNIPVEIKADKIVLPKKSLVAELISKGLDINAKISESFAQEVLNKISSIEEKIAYEIKEAEDIIAERPTVTKTANESRNTMFEGDTDTLTVQKHLLPNHENMKLHDKVSDGTDQWEIVNMEAQQLDKNENSSSLWTLKKCKAPEADKKEPETKIKA